MKTMLDKFFVGVAFAGMLASLSFARPAPPGVETVQNKDGSSVSVRYFGDEHYHYAETSDGYLVAIDSVGNYVYVNENGSLSGVVAKNAVDRTEKEKSFLNGLNQETARQKHKELNGGRFPDDSLTQGKSVPLLKTSGQDETSLMLRRPKTTQRWTTGERWFPVLLVGTTDKAHGDSLAFYNYLNEPGYSVNHNVGSLRDYFLFVSDSLFNPHFDVYPIDIEASLTSFGTGKNYNEGKLVVAGLEKLGKRSDFLKNADKYCSEGKNIDGFIFLYPGMEKDALAQSESFWSHKYQMSANGSTSAWNPSAYKVGDYYFEEYVFNAQYADGSNNSVIDKMGILAHEFSHMMGLKDHYSRDGNGEQIDGPGSYDIMSTGMYNGNTINAGNAPMGYSAFEKAWIGWLELKELEPNQEYSLKKLSKMEAYTVSNPMQNDEYYIVEYRPAEKFDAFTFVGAGKKNNGVYVWYIDYDKKIFSTGSQINADQKHQRVAINAVLGAGGYFVDFTYVNNGGTSPISGIYNLVFDGQERACFTTSKDMALSECPEDSSAVVASSSSVEEDVSSSSNATEWLTDKPVAMNRLQFQLEGDRLLISNASGGIKKVSLFDMQGHLLLRNTFSESQATLDLNRIPHGNYVVLVNNANQTIKKVIAK